MARRSKSVAKKSRSKRGKAVRRKATKRAAAKKTNKLAKKMGKKLSKKVRHSPIAKARKKKRSPTPTLETPIETSVIDVIQEPTPGVLVVSEIEATRIALPDSDEKSDEQSLTPGPERSAA
jgi:hypothetical protein